MKLRGEVDHCKYRTEIQKKIKTIIMKFEYDNSTTKGLVVLWIIPGSRRLVKICVPVFAFFCSSLLTSGSCSCLKYVERFRNTERNYIAQNILKK